MDQDMKKEVSRLRSEVRRNSTIVEELKNIKKEINPFTGVVSGNYWTATGMPWVSSEGRKAVLTEWFWQPIRGQPRRVDTNELRQFSQTSWVYSCVKTILDEVTALDWDIVPKEDFDYHSIKDQIREVKEFMSHPNKNRESFNEVLRALLKDVLEIDAGVLVKVFDLNSYNFDELEPKSGSPTLKPLGQRKMVEVYARDGASFLKEVDKFGFLLGAWQYSYQIPAHPMWFNRDEFVYVMQQTRSMSPYGFAITQGILDIVKQLHYSTLYNKKFFEETAIPAGALFLEQTNELEMTAFRDYWNGDFKAQPHKTAIINKKGMYQPFVQSQRELEFLETQKWYYQLVISAFGLTPTELGLTEDVNKSTSATQAEVTKRKAIRPLLKLIENYINEGIIPEFGYEGLQFQFIYDDPAEKSLRLSNWKLELDLGIKTINDIRVEEGLEPVAWGEYPTQLLPTMQQGPNQNQGLPQKGNQGGDFSPEEKKDDPNPPNAESQAEGSQDKIEESQSPGYEDQMRREQADQEAQKLVMDPFLSGRRPVGSFRSITPEKFKSLTEGEKREVIREVYQALSQDMYLILQRMGLTSTAAATASQALRMRGRTKGVNDGQYYFEPNEVLMASDLRTPDMGAERDYGTRYPQNQFIQGTDDDVNCPQCGMATLASLNSADDIGREPSYKCLNCGFIGSKQDVIDNNVLRNFIQTLQRNPPVDGGVTTVPKWTPKSAKDESFFYISELDMTVSQFAGFDVSKANEFTHPYITSAEYRKLLEGYLSDISDDKIKKIINVIALGIRNGTSIGKIKEQISRIIKDPARAEAIARTETIRVVNEGNRLELKDNGVKKVQWISAPKSDSRLCEACKKRDGKYYDIEKVKNEIPLHPNCRCRIA